MALAAQYLKQMKGTKQQSTVEQRDAVTKLVKWINKYHKIARVALQDKPEILEKLGIRILSAPTAAQRAARDKASQTRAAKKAQQSTIEKPPETLTDEPKTEPAPEPPSENPEK